MQESIVTPRGGSRSRSWLVGAVVVFVLCAAVVLLLLRAGRTIPASPEMRVHRLPELGIEFEYPASWHLQSFDEPVGLSSLKGALVSNVQHLFAHPDLGPNEHTSAWDMRGLPDDIIVVSFEQLDRHNTEAGAMQGLPLDLDDAVVSRDAAHGNPVYGAPQPRFFLPYAVEGHLGSGAQIFIGEVDRDERAVVDRILASVRPLDR